MLCKSRLLLLLSFTGVISTTATATTLEVTRGGFVNGALGSIGSRDPQYDALLFKDRPDLKLYFEDDLSYEQSTEYKVWQDVTFNDPLATDRMTVSLLGTAFDSSALDLDGGYARILNISSMTLNQVDLDSYSVNLNFWGDDNSLTLNDSTMDLRYVYLKPRGNAPMHLAVDTGMQKAVIDIKESPRLVKGPAFNTPLKEQAQGWNHFRYGNKRLSYNENAVSAKLAPKWEVKIAPGEKLTQPVANNRRVYVAAVRKNTLYALDQNTGKTLWTFNTAGQIDSSPSLWKGRVIFGSADGYLYCLNAEDGELVWSFRGAKGDRQMTIDGRMESVWPIHGSNPIVDGTIYCLAGRTIFLDGGLRLSLIDAATGELKKEVIHGDKDERDGIQVQVKNQGQKMVPGNSDILSFDGKHIYMNSQRIGLDGNRIYKEGHGKHYKTLTFSRSDQDGEGTHLFAPVGFLDDSWHHRSFWIYGKGAGSGWGGWQKPGKYVPTGRLMVVKPDHTVYSFGRKPEFFAQAHIMEYMISSSQGNAYKPGDWEKTFTPIRNKEASITNWKQNSKLPIEKLSSLKFNWRNTEPGLLGRAMAGAGESLFIAGPPDILDETKLYGRFSQPDSVAKIKAQQDAIDGSMGAILRSVSTVDGKTVAEYKLSAPPVFDGMSAANGKLFIVLQDGSMVCLNSADDTEGLNAQVEK